MSGNTSTDVGGLADLPMEDRELKIVLDVTRGGPCVMDDVDGDVVDLDIRFQDDTCNVDMQVRQSGQDRFVTKHFSNGLCRYCPGKLFAEHDSLPRYLEIRDGSFLLETYVSDTDAVTAIVSDLREICESVSVRSIMSTENSCCPEASTIDVTALTPKQREAVYHAQEAGYYDPDSSVPLEELADWMDVSPSALSQRLKRAEANIVRQISCECSCWPGPE